MITLATLPQATPQEVFEQGKNHLLQQNAKSTSESGCKYRWRGKKCAGGCFISNEEYLDEMEGNSWETLVEWGFVPKEHMRMISALQYIHDAYAVEQWPSVLEKMQKVLDSTEEVQYVSWLQVITEC